MTLSLILGLLLAATLGVAAGVITTISGFGGGLLLTLALAPWLGPSAALVVAAPALAIGHVHRALGYREHIDARIARRFILAAVPGAMLGAMLAASIPESALALALLLGAALAGAQAFGLIPTALGRRAPGARSAIRRGPECVIEARGQGAKPKLYRDTTRLSDTGIGPRGRAQGRDGLRYGLLIPGAASIGFLAGSCGGGGVLLPPTLMSAGLAGRRFVATAATGALAVQMVRISTYAASGMVEPGQVPQMLAVAVGLVGGNAIGRRLATRIDDARTAVWTRSTLAITIVLGLWGMWR